MWFAHDLLQPGVPAFNMIVCSRPIIVIVVPLLEAELAIDPGAVKLGEVINIVQLWGFLLNSLPGYLNKAGGGTKQVAAVFWTKLLRIPSSDLYSCCSPNAWIFRQIAWQK